MQEAEQVTVRFKTRSVQVNQGDWLTFTEARLVDLSTGRDLATAKEILEVLRQEYGPHAQIVMDDLQQSNVDDLWDMLETRFRTRFKDFQQFAHLVDKNFQRHWLREDEYLFIGGGKEFVVIDWEE